MGCFIGFQDAYKDGRDDEQNFIQNLSLFLCSFLKEHSQLIEKKPELNEILMESLHYLIMISEVDETEIFKICLEYWNSLAADLYRESPFGSHSTLLIGRMSDMPLRRQLYNPILSKVSTHAAPLYNPILTKVSTHAAPLYNPILSKVSIRYIAILRLD